MSVAPHGTRPFLRCNCNSAVVRASLVGQSASFYLPSSLPRRPHPLAAHGLQRVHRAALALLTRLLPHRILSPPIRLSCAMFSLCVNPSSAPDSSSTSLRPSPRLWRDALRWRRRSLRLTLRNFPFRRSRPLPGVLNARSGPCLVNTKRPSTPSLLPQHPKSTYDRNSCRDASQPYAFSHSSSGSLSSCTDRDEHSSMRPLNTPSQPVNSPASLSATSSVPPLDERFLFCSTSSLPTVPSAEALSDPATNSAANSPHSTRSLSRLLDKLPDVRDAPARPCEVEHAEQRTVLSSSQSRSDHSLSPECAPQASHSTCDDQYLQTPPVYAQLEPQLPHMEDDDDDDDDELNFTVPIVPTFPEDRLETRTNRTSLFGIYPPPSLLHPDRHAPTQAISALAAYAEDDQEEEGLDDIDLSGVDDSQSSHPSTHTQLPAMRMDAVSLKWVGNEHEFVQFDSIVASMRDDLSEDPERDAVFDVSEELMQQWQQDCEEHNRWFAIEFQDDGAADICDVVGLFTRGQSSALQQVER
ncbi:unnamed protein product [Agarophyton chilense]